MGRRDLPGNPADIFVRQSGSSRPRRRDAGWVVVEVEHGHDGVFRATNSFPSSQLICLMI